MGTEGGDKCVDNVDKLRKKWWLKRDGSERDLLMLQTSFGS